MTPDCFEVTSPVLMLVVCGLQHRATAADTLCRTAVRWHVRLHHLLRLQRLLFALLLRLLHLDGFGQPAYLHCMKFAIILSPNAMCAKAVSYCPTLNSVRVNREYAQNGESHQDGTSWVMIVLL